MFSVALLLLLAAGSYVKCEQLTQPASVTVQPGQRLTITCQVSYSVSSYATHWIRQPAGKELEWIGYRSTGGFNYKDSLKNKFSISLDSSSKTLTLNGQNVQPEDTAVYYCARGSGSNYFDYWGKGTMVTVTSVTSNGPTVFPLTACGSGTGDMITLGCLATDFTPSSLTFAWTKAGTALTEFIQYPSVQKGDLYTGVSQIQVRRQDWDARQTWQCAVTHVAGNAGPVDFTKPKVICQLPTLKVLASSEEENEVSFSCFAKDFSPKDYEIKWLKDGVEITDKIYEIKTPIDEKQFDNGTKLYSASSFLTMKSSKVPPKTKLTCRFKGKNEICDGFINSTLTYGCDGTGGPGNVEINIEDPSLEDMFLHRKGTIKCHVKVNEGAVERIFWEDEDLNEMAGASKTPPNGKKGQFTHDLAITYDEWIQGIKRYCVVELVDGMEPFKKLYDRNTGGQTLLRPSVFMMPPVEHKDKVTLTCYVKDFSPQEVFVSWLVDDEAADSKTYKFSTTNPVENNGSYSAYGQLSLSLEQWKDKDMVYSCVVYHQTVANSTKAIVRSIGQRTFEKTNLVNLNMNVPETCKAQ